MSDWTTIRVHKETLAMLREEIAHRVDRVLKELETFPGFVREPKNPNAQNITPEQLIRRLLCEVLDKRRRGRESSERRTARRRTAGQSKGGVQ